MQIKKGSTDRTFTNVRAVDATSGQPKTGLTYSDITARYVRTRSASQAITPASLASVITPHADGGFIEIDATNCKGLYRFDAPDAAFAGGADEVVIMLQANGTLFSPIAVELVDNTAADLVADVTMIRRFVANSRQVDHGTDPNVEVIRDDADTGTYATRTQSEPSPGLVKETVVIV